MGGFSQRPKTHLTHSHLQAIQPQRDSVIIIACVNCLQYEWPEWKLQDSESKELTKLLSIADPVEAHTGVKSERLPMINRI